MNILTAKKIFTFAERNDDSVLISSDHGIGKSSVVYQFSKENNFHFETLLLSQQEVGDLVGIPKTKELDGEIVTYWTKPEWFKRIEIAASKNIKSVLFLDELNRSQQDVLQTALQLILDGQIHDHKLPKNELKTFIISAINPSDNYQTTELDKALLDRFLKLNVEVDAKCWLDWAYKNNINSTITSFISENPEFIHWTPEQDDEKSEFDNCGSSPRSLAKLSGYIDDFQSGELDSDYLFNIIKGKVGEHIGYILYSYVLNNNHISADDIIELIIQLQKYKATDEEYSESVKEFIEDIQGIQKVQIAENLIKKTSNNYKYILIFLYSLEIEYVIPILKTLKEENPNFYKHLSDADMINNKKLFKRIVDLIQK